MTASVSKLSYLDFSTPAQLVLYLEKQRLKLIIVQNGSDLDHLLITWIVNGVRQDKLLRAPYDIFFETHLAVQAPSLHRFLMRHPSASGKK